MVYLRSLIIPEVIAVTALKVLLMAVTLLSFPSDVAGVDIRLESGSTKGMRVYVTPLGDTVLHISWKAKFGNYDVSDTSEVVEFNVRMTLSDKDGFLLYDNSLTKAKVKSGKIVTVKGIISLSIADSKKIVGVNFEVDRSRQELAEQLESIRKQTEKYK